MSDYDRGAYTPPTDEAFAFDARSPRLSRPAPATLVGSLVVLVVLVGAVGLFYWSGVRGSGEAPRVVGKPQVEIKTAPPPVDAKPIADDDKLDVYDQEKGQAASAPASGKAAFAPPPEEPQPRPTAQAQARAAAPPPAAAAKVPAQAAPTPAPIQAQAPPVVKTAPPPAAASAPVKTAAAPPAKPAPAPPARRDAVKELLARNDAAASKPAPAAAKPAPVAAKPATEVPHGLLVQIGAYSSSAIADAELGKAKAAYGSYVAGKAKHVERAEVNGKTFYRAAFAGFDREGARAFCKALIPAKIACIVK